MYRLRSVIIAVFVTALGLASGLPTVATAKEVITLWSHFADQEGAKRVLYEAKRRFEEKNPNAELQISWFQKEPLYVKQATALRAKQGPDILYLEPDKLEYIDNGFLLPLNEYVDLEKYLDVSKEVWTRDGKVYAFPVQSYTVELFYNKDLLKDLGFELPESRQFTQDQFHALVRKAHEKGITVIGQGVGDRPFPGSYLTHELLLKKLGKKDYAQLWAGTLSFEDSRVVQVLTYVKTLVDSGLYPKNFMSLKLGESHYYFHTKPKSVALAMGSWYTNRAFVAPDKSGQPVDFNLGIMKFPAMDDGVCNQCKSGGVSASYAINAGTKHPELASQFLREMQAPDIANMWLENTYVQYGMKGANPAGMTGPYADFFTELVSVNEDADLFVGTPIDHISGGCREAFVQVLNQGLPGGLLSVEKTAQTMNAACYKPNKDK